MAINDFWSNLQTNGDCQVEIENACDPLVKFFAIMIFTAKKKVSALSRFLIG